MQAYWWWWGLAVMLGVLELLTGTLYLLVLGLGFAAGGLLAFAGAGLAAQLVSASVVAVAGWFALRRWSPRRRGAGGAPEADIQLDVGQHVRVEAWQAGRRARVLYRGATWEAELDPAEAGEPAPGEHVILRIEGSRLVVGRPR